MTIEDYIDTKTGGIKAKALQRVKEEWIKDPEFAGYLAIVLLEMSNMIVEENNAGEEECTA